MFAGAHVSKDIIVRRMNRMFDTSLAIFGASTQLWSLVLVSWAHPPPSFVKLNTSGSSLGNPGCAGFGGLIRDEGGVWICGISSYIP